MPLYEYRCEEDHTFEVVQPINDDALTSCEVCSAPARRVLYAPAVHFKGKGFYNTDYGTRKRNREKEASESSSTEKSSGEKKSESSDSKTESKPAEKKKDTATTGS